MKPNDSLFTMKSLPSEHKAKGRNSKLTGVSNQSKAIRRKKSSFEKQPQKELPMEVEDEEES